MDSHNHGKLNAVSGLSSSNAVTPGLWTTPVGIKQHKEMTQHII